MFSMLATTVCLSIGLCAYVAQCFKTGRFPHVWQGPDTRPLLTST